MKGDVFGQKGDFITAPEISQVFGEVGVAALCTQSSEYNPGGNEENKSCHPALPKNVPTGIIG